MVCGTCLTHTQLTNLSQAGAWGDIEKPWHDIAFLMIVLSANFGGKQIFGLAAVWAHPHQCCLDTLVEVAHTLVLLVDDGPNWPYAFICMSSTTHHAPLLDAGHLGTMTDGLQSVNACGHLHQLLTWKLLQHREHVVFPEGLNRELKAHHFSFPELPPWDTATAGGSAGELPPTEVTLGGTKHKSMLTIPPSSVSLTPASHHDKLGGKLPYEALGDLPPFPNKGSAQPGGDGLTFACTYGHLPPGIPR